MRRSLSPGDGGQGNEPVAGHQLRVPCREMVCCGSAPSVVSWRVPSRLRVRPRPRGGGDGEAVAEAVVAAAVGQTQPEVGGADPRGAEQRQAVGGLGGQPGAGIGAGGVRGQAGHGGPAVERVRAAGRGPAPGGGEGQRQAEVGGGVGIVAERAGHAPVGEDGLVHQQPMTADLRGEPKRRGGPAQAAAEVQAEAGARRRGARPIPRWA